MRVCAWNVAQTLVALAVVAGSGSPALAGIHLVSGSLDSAPLNPENTERSLSGHVAPFGSVQGVLAFTALNTDGSFTAEFVLQGADGTVSGTVSGQFLSATQYVEMITLTDGTGRYKGITGLIALAGAVNPMTGAGHDVILGGIAVYK